jgi:hypothetical protein
METGIEETENLLSALRNINANQNEIAAILMGCRKGATELAMRFKGPGGNSSPY